MTAEWTPPSPTWELVGTVTYRCPCGELIEGEPVLADGQGPLGDRPVNRDTLAYHPEHVPTPEVTPDGR